MKNLGSQSERRAFYLPAELQTRAPGRVSAVVPAMPTTKGRFIAYYRVSTVQQGQSGLGLEAQRKTVLDYLNGGRWDLIAAFTEVESGKRGDRPELAKALAACRLHRATLLIAKIDRLSREQWLTGWRKC